MILDVHYHVGTKAYGRYDFSIDKQWVLDEMKMFGVQKTVVFPYKSPHSYQVLNQEIIDTFADNNILPFSRLRLNFRSGDAFRYLSKIKIHGISKRSLRIIKEIKGRRGIPAYQDEETEKGRFSATMEHCKGIKFHDNQDGHLQEEQFEFLLSFRKPIVMHINPYKLEYFLSLFSSAVHAPVVIAHLGGIDADSIYLEKTREMLKKYDWLYTDTAAHVFANYLVPFLREIPEKILFGSDGPVVSQGSTMALVQQCGRELFKDKDKSVEIIAENSGVFCRESGWESL